MAQEAGTGTRTQPPYPLHPSVVPRLAPDYAAFYNEHLIDQQQVHLRPVEESRSSGVLIPGAGPEYPVGAKHDFVAQSPGGLDISMRVFTPQPGDHHGSHRWPLLMYYHGGGWVLGNIDTENVIATHLCGRTNYVVATVDYRLAPENPFPAAVEDAWEAMLWMVQGPGKDRFQIDTNKVAVGGSSAGANLAAVMCQRAIDRSLPGVTFTAQLHSVPVADNTASPETKASWRENALVPALPAAKMMWYRRHYLPNEKDWANPEASPLLWGGDWSKLPPAEVVLGELDVLRTEGEEFAAKLVAAGRTSTRVTIMKGQPHPFIAMDGVLESGKQAIDLFVKRLQDSL